MQRIEIVAAVTAALRYGGHIGQVTSEVLMYIIILQFLPRDASAERGDATVSCLSVRP